MITVLAIDRDQVKIGIAAPRDVSIHRQEVLQAVRDQEKIQEYLAGNIEAEKFDLLRSLLADENDKNSEENEDPTTK